MAIETHGLTYSHVLAELGGVDTTEIAAGNAANLPLADVTGWIEDGAGIMTSLYVSLGASVSSDESVKVWKRGVLAYAKARVYERLNRMDASAAAMSEHKDAKKDARSFPDETGATTVGTGVSSNVDVSAPFKKKFLTRRSSSGDGGFGGW